MFSARRLAAAAVATTLAGGAVSLVAPATAQTAAPNGIGTATAATSLLRVELGQAGSLLGLRLLGDDSRSTIDPEVASVPSAFTRLAPLDVTSSILPALKVALPNVEAKSPGGTGSTTTQAISLASPASAGTLDPANLVATAKAGEATSALTSALKNVSLVGGLVSLPNVTSSLGTAARTGQADGTRGLKIDRVTVLDLGALLDGLGLKLTDLPVGVVSDLLGGLGVPVPGLGQGVALEDAVAQLDAAIEEVQQLLATAGATVDQTVSTTVGGIVDDLGDTLGGLLGGTPVGGVVESVPVPTVGSAIATLNTTIDSLQATLGDLLGDALQTLDGVALLSADGIEAGLVTKAAPTVAGSVAQVTGKIGSVSVGGVALPGVDLGAAATQVTGLVNGVTAKLQQTLGSIAPGLGNLVSLKVLDQSKGVGGTGGAVQADAAVTVLKAVVTPPADLAAIVGGIVSQTGVGDLLGQLGATVPALSGAMSTLEGALGNVQALAGGVSVAVGELVSGATYQAASLSTGVPVTPAAPAGGDELPRTGGDGAFAFLGVLALAAAAVAGRWLRRPVAG